MRVRLLVLLTSLALASPSWAAVVQSQTDAATQPWVTDGIAEVTFSAAVTVGNTVCVGFGLDAANRSISSVADDGGPTNTYALAATVEVTGISEAWIYCGVVARAATVVSVTISSACTCTGVIFGWELSGAHATTPVGNTATNAVTVATTSHPSPSSGTLALTDATAQLLGFSYGSTGSWTLDGGFTSLWNRNIGTAGYQSVSAADSMVNTTAGNETSSNILVEIRPAASGSAPNFFSRRLQVNP